VAGGCLNAFNQRTRLFQEVIMPYATLDGIKTNYQVTGSGMPLLMLAPGGFDSSIMRWSASGAWQELLPLNALVDQFQVIAYDRL
jgi:pimeloyl-ACP methyl ester carboxylesterase